MKVVNIDVRKLNCSDVQNPARDGELAIKGLLGDIEKNGVLSPIQVVRGERQGSYIISDGHRRVACLKLLGHKTAPCLVRDMDDKQLYASSNSQTRQQKGQDWYYGWARLADDRNYSISDENKYLDSMPSCTMNAIKRMKKIFGRRRAIDIGLSGKQSPNISTHIPIVHHFLMGKLGDSCKVSLIDVGEWMVLNGQSCRTFIRGNPTKKRTMVFHSRIRRGQPFTKSDWYE